MLQEFLRNYAPNWFILWLVAMFIAYPDRDVIQITIGLMFMTAWIYFVHRALHELPKDGIIGSLNTHWRFHHGPEKALPRWLELCLETISDTGMFLSLYLLQHVTNVWFVPQSVLLLYLFGYVSGHIINYSILGSTTHRQHHMNLGTNFGPDLMDHLFLTSHDGTLEDMTWFIPNILVGGALVYQAKRQFKWED
jgi:hypothetical protein